MVSEITSTAMDKSFAMQTVAECLSRLDDRIGRIEADLTVLAKERTVRESYSTKQRWPSCSKRTFTQCASGAGSDGSGPRSCKAEEAMKESGASPIRSLERYQNEGLLPLTVLARLR